jgi:tRNA nucleotidyltransferase (CCA-adding enzyme)
MNSVIKGVLTQFERHGYEAYVIGGYVRDALLGIRSDDVDITTSATPQQVKELFEHTLDVGIAHGSVTVIVDQQSFDITTFRSDGSYANHRHPDHVDFGDSLEMDVARRDFTMNAIAMNAKEDLIDLVGGRSDIEQKRIKAIGDPFERMQEDALRIVRALRFVSVLGFALDAPLFEAMKEHQHLVSTIAMERIQMEVQKLLRGHYIDQVNHYLKSLSIAVLPPQFVNDPTLSLVEQLGIAEHNDANFQSKFILSKPEQKQLTFLRALTSDVPDNYQLYASAYPEAMIRVGSVLYGWDRQQLEAQLKHLVIHQRVDLAITGHDIKQLGLQGPAIESVLIHIEKAVVAHQIPNQKPEILAYAKEITREN